MKDSSREVFTTGEIAKLCGVTHRTVVNWISRGALASYKLPGRRGDNRVTISNLLEFMANNQLPIPAELQQEQSQQLSAQVKNRVHYDILIVDDDRSMARAIERIFRQAGYSTIVAHDGFEAGALFSSHSPRLVTLDLQMPHMNGLAVLRNIKQTAEAFVVVISAAANNDLSAATALGADAVFCKPFDNKKVLELVSSLISGSFKR